MCIVFAALAVVRKWVVDAVESSVCKVGGEFVASDSVSINNCWTREAMDEALPVCEPK